MTLPNNTKLTIEEAVESLTGFEELEIVNRFGDDVSTLLKEKPTMGMRALACMLVARTATADDLKDPKGKAYTHVMGLTLKAIDAFFPDDEPEPVLDGDEPVTPAGKPDEPAS